MDDFYDEWAGYPTGGSSYEIPSNFDWGSVDFGNLDLGGLDLSGIDLSGLDLSGIDLGNFDFRGLDMIPATASLTPEDISAIIGSPIAPTPENVFEYGYTPEETLFVPADLDVIPRYATPENVFEYGYPEDTEALIPRNVDVIPGYATPENVFEYGYEPEQTPFIPQDVDVLSGYVPNEEELKDQFWKNTIGTGTAVPGAGEIKTVAYDDGSKQTIITRPDGTEEVLDTTDTEGNVTPGPRGPGPSGPATTGSAFGGTGGAKGGAKTIADAIKSILGDGNKAGQIAGLLGLLNSLLNKPTVPGYRGGIPKYTAVRGPRGKSTHFVRNAAGGGLMDLAAGGKPARYLRGGTNGMDDKIQTNIDGKQPARLSHGEFVIPADTVSALGGGNSDAGAQVLYDMMDRVRQKAYGRKKQINKVRPKDVLPA